MGNEQKLLIRNGIEKIGIPVERKNRFFMRACAPILVAALAAGGLAAGCNSAETSAEETAAAQRAVKTEENQALLKAANKNNVDNLKKALDEGADPNLGAPLGKPILRGVCELGRLRIAEELINRGANVNYSDGRGTALTFALENGHFDTAKMLIRKGANVNTESGSGSPLTIAIRKRSPALVKILVEQGADIENSRNGSATEFLVAVQDGNLEIVKHLFAKGADMDAKVNGRGAITLAIENENYKIAEFLVDNTQIIQGISELREAARKGSLGLAKKLVAKGADFTVFKDVETPLMAAAEEGKLEMARYLLEEPLFLNALNAEDERGETALIKAAGAGKLDVVRLLIKADADLNAKDDSGKTALAHAEANERKETYKFLLSKGAKY